MSHATIEELRSSVLEGKKYPPEYAAKQIHPVPESPVVNRKQFILDRVKDKVVLDVGASGPLHKAIVEVSKQVWAIDHPRGGERPGVFLIDLDKYGSALPNREIDVVVCGEVIEHLSNPGFFLERLKATYPGVPVIITVPNAFCESGMRQMLKGIENCNKDHVAWYSNRTLTTLVERVGYEIKERAWYNGKPRFAEGLVFVIQ